VLPTCWLPKMSWATMVKKDESPGRTECSPSPLTTLLRAVVGPGDTWSTRHLGG
jgi:hypothetical protein